MSYFISLDQGTTSSRAVLYDERGQELKICSRELPVRFPQDGWVEQDPRDIWSTQLEALREAAQGVAVEEIKALGITNQRETTIAWDPASGKPAAPAIVWQCRRSSGICARLREQGKGELISRRTGLIIDPYFSGSKILWMLEHVEGLRVRAERGEVVFGTVDSWLIYQLTGGASGGIVVTEPSNASRTMLFSIETGSWDPELLSLFQVSEQNLPSIRPSVGEFGQTAVLGPEIPITGVLGDQQAALLGHGCVSESDIKCTFGTGAFLLLNTGASPIRSESGLLTTVAWSEGLERTYAVEGSIFMAGALIQWLRDGLRLIESAPETEQLADSVTTNAGVVIVPAFTGLGAPYWDDAARGGIFGLTREAGKAHLVRAALEAVAHQVADLTESSEFSDVSSMRIDGGMSVNAAFCRILAGLTGLTIEVSPTAEVTALGAVRAAKAGLAAEGSIAGAAASFGVVSGAAGTTYSPELAESELKRERARWKDAVSRVSTR